MPPHLDAKSRAFRDTLDLPSAIQIPRFETASMVDLSEPEGPITARYSSLVLQAAYRSQNERIIRA